MLKTKVEKMADTGGWTLWSSFLMGRSPCANFAWVFWTMADSPTNLSQHSELHRKGVVP